jgi:RNA polymerase sigma-70 factor, ECF subfamily
LVPFPARSSPRPMNDKLIQLVRQAQEGDHAAASELIKNLYIPVYSFLRRQCRSDSDAADLTQQAFCVMWDSIRNFKERSSVSTWIHGIAFNVYRSWRRKWKPDEICTEEWWANCPTLAPNPFQNAADRDLSLRLYELVDRLDLEVKETVHLHYFQGLTIEETASALGIASSTVKYRIRQAVAELRRQMETSQTSHPFSKISPP